VCWIFGEDGDGGVDDDDDIDVDDDDDDLDDDDDIDDDNDDNDVDDDLLDMLDSSDLLDPLDPLDLSPSLDDKPRRRPQRKTKAKSTKMSRARSIGEEDYFDTYRRRWDLEERNKMGVVLDVDPPPPNDGVNNLRYLAFVRDPVGGFGTRLSESEGHVRWCMESARMGRVRKEESDGGNVPTVVFSHALLAGDLQSEVGHVLCVDGRGRGEVEGFVGTEPIARALGLELGGGGGGGKGGVEVVRWEREGHHLLRMDDGHGGVPHVVRAEYGEGEGEGRRGKYPEFLEWLKSERRAIMVGEIFGVGCGARGSDDDDDDDDDDSRPTGCLLALNAPDVPSVQEFLRGDPTGFGTDVLLSADHGKNFIAQYNKVDVSGKFLAVDKYDPEWTSDLEKELQEKGGFEPELTPWTNF